jgi:hypothetical protein
MMEKVDNKSPIELLAEHIPFEDKIVIKVKTNDFTFTSKIFSSRKINPQSELEKITNRLQILET